MKPSAPRRLAFALLDLGAWLVPARDRDRWRQQWRADLWHRCDALERAGLVNTRTSRAVLGRAAGALWHAGWLRLRGGGGQMFLHDLRHAARGLSGRPGFTGIAVLTLALGIGANSVIFSWIDATLLHPLPGITDSGSVVALYGTERARNNISLSYPNYVDLRAAAVPGVRSVAVFSAGALGVRTNEGTERVWGAVVSGNLFETLGVGAAVGRVFTPDDDRHAGAHPVAVLTHAAWQRRYGGRADIVGSTLVIRDRPFTIVGVTPPGFHGPQALIGLDLFIPVAMLDVLMPSDRLTARGSAWLSTLVRLAPGASMAEAQAGVDVVARQLAAAYPDANSDRGMRLFPLWRQPQGGTAQLLPVMAVLGGVVAVLLALVVANMTGLLLARASGRQRELAVRVSLGASRWQVVRLLLAETTVLAVVAGGVAALVTAWSGNLLYAFIPPLPIPIVIDAGLNLRVLVFSSAVSLVAGLVLGLLPGLQASRADLVAPLKDGANTGGSARRGRLRQGLIVAQVALALVMLVSAGLFLRTLDAADRLDLGFSARQGLVGVVDVGATGLEPARGLATYRTVTAALRELPGVEAVALAQRLPLTSLESGDRTVEIAGYTPAPGEEMTAYYASVGPGYFDALRLPLVEGREVTDRDTADAPPAVIVNTTMAQRFWPGRSALGGRVKIGERWADVVGVARDAKYSSLSEPATPFMYLPVEQAYRPSMRVFLRTTGDPDALAPAVRQTLARVAPGVPLFDVQTLAQHIAFSFFLIEMAATLLALFGATAALLAALGLYGVIAQNTAARTREIGVRMSLGATAADVGRLVVGQGLGLTAFGIVLGLAGAAGVTRLFESQLLGVSALDPLAFGATTILLAATTVAACAIPAWRAARLDPVRALRMD